MYYITTPCKVFDVGYHSQCSVFPLPNAIKSTLVTTYSPCNDVIAIVTPKEFVFITSVLGCKQKPNTVAIY